MQRLRRPFLAAWAALLALSCGAAPAEPEPAPPPPGDVSTGPWTRAFLRPANLIADEIVVEGPPALRVHFSARQESQRTVYSAKTTSKGFLQELTARPEAGFVELRATLDTWELVALKRITWLERPSSAPVVIRASGSAVFQSVEDGEVKKGELLEFRGDVPH